jgi:two-component system, NtrC family, sensor histidine kinase HydH
MKLVLAMAAAVGLVFAAAFVDSRRDAERELADFSAEQSLLAQTFALSAGARLSAAPFDSSSKSSGASPAALFDGAPLGDLPSAWLIMDGARRWTLHGPRDLGWHDDAGATDDLRALFADVAAGKRGARFIDRNSAAAIGLGARGAVAGFAPLPSGGGVAVVTSARRVRDRGRLGAWRILASTGLAALMAGLFGAAVTRQRRRAESLAAALRLAGETAALRERAQKIVEAIPLGVLALDAAGRVTSVNPFAAERGVRAGAPLAETFAATLDGDSAAAIAALVKTATETRATAARHGLRLALAHPPRDFDAYAVPLARPLPDVDCFVVLHDRTDVRLLERNLQRAEKLATIGTLAAGVAHEVGTPLGIISGRAESLLARLGDGDEAAKKALTSIVSQVEKVSTTIRQLLDFARARPVERVDVAARDVLANAAALLEHRFRQKKVTLTVDAPPSLPPLAADPGQLEQVIVNLLVNACDACAEGGHVGARAIAVGGAVKGAVEGADGNAAGRVVEIEIHDDGCGIAPENLPSVLDPFFTTKKRGQGTGLGLTIVDDIVKNHDGTLAIESAPGRGTTVRVRLPAGGGDEA